MISMNKCDEIQVAFHMQHVYSFIVSCVVFTLFFFHLSELSALDMGVQRVQSYFSYKQQGNSIFFWCNFFIPFLSQDVKMISQAFFKNDCKGRELPSSYMMSRIFSPCIVLL